MTKWNNKLLKINKIIWIKLRQIKIKINYNKY